MAKINQDERLRVYRTMRAKLLERGVKCGLADSYAMASVQLYKWGVRRGCANVFELVTSARRVNHYAALAGK